MPHTLAPVTSATSKHTKPAPLPTSTNRWPARMARRSTMANTNAVLTVPYRCARVSLSACRWLACSQLATTSGVTNSALRAARRVAQLADVTGVCCVRATRAPPRAHAHASRLRHVRLRVRCRLRAAASAQPARRGSAQHFDRVAALGAPREHRGLIGGPSAVPACRRCVTECGATSFDRWLRGKRLQTSSARQVL